MPEAVVELLDPNTIIVADRLRGVDPAWVEVLAASITDKGQDTPIRVRRDEGALHLVYGAHRLEACRRIGVEVKAEIVECSELEARLMEIDENLFRRELGALDRAVFMCERQDVYLQLYPETAKGVAGGKARQGAASDILSFAAETAARTGFSRRTIERAVKLARAIPRDVRERLRGTAFADRQVDLDALSDLAPDQQRQVVALIVGGGAKDLKKAMGIVLGTSAPPLDADDLQFAALEKAWVRASTVARERFIALIRETGDLEN